jgi:hypothetical protein
MNWQITTTPDNNHPHRFKLTAIYRAPSTGKATRVIHRDNLTQEEVDTWNPEACFEVGLTANHRHARAIRKTLGWEKS